MEGAVNPRDVETAWGSRQLAKSPKCRKIPCHTGSVHYTIRKADQGEHQVSKSGNDAPSGAQIDPSLPPLEALERAFGDRARRSPMERFVYSRDLAPVPDLLLFPLGIFARPDIIVQPESHEEVAAVIQLAAKHRIPVTPRAGGSTVFFQTVPYRKGILLDLNGLRG